jgi:hypothetical protein
VPIAQWLIRRVEFRIARQSWPILFTHRALLLCESLTGADMLGAAAADLSASMLRALLFSALSAGGAPCSIEDVGRRIAAIGVDAARDLAAEAWDACMPEPTEPSDDPEPEEPLTWLKAWGIARECHHLSDEEWLDMTPRQFAVLQGQRLQEMQRIELMAGVITATIQNFSMCHPETPASAEQFMLHKFPVRKKNEDAPVTGEDIMAEMAKARGQHR